MEYADCPVCSGTGFVESNGRRNPCRNCGGQTMEGRATGRVPLNKNGDPCTHKYEYKLAGRCYHKYTCTECGYVYHIDSGD